MFRQVLG